MKAGNGPPHSLLVKVFLLLGCSRLPFNALLRLDHHNSMCVACFNIFIIQIFKVIKNITLYMFQDLAARNVLINEEETCKVSDFGLLRELPKDDSIYHMSTAVPCPVRWMSPESIEERNFSPASDVWSFGILQWEMFNPKCIPYPNFGNMEVVMKVTVCGVYSSIRCDWSMADNYVWPA